MTTPVIIIACCIVIPLALLGFPFVNWNKFYGINEHTLERYLKKSVIIDFKKNKGEKID